MTWENVGNFLDRFANLKPPKKFVQDEVVETIKNFLGVEIKPEEIEIRAGTIYIKIKNSSLKNEIFLKKNILLEKLKERLAKRAPTDLRF